MRRRLISALVSLGLVAAAGAVLPACHPTAWDFCNATKPASWWTVTTAYFRTDQNGNPTNYVTCRASDGTRVRCWVGLNDGDHQAVYYDCLSAIEQRELLQELFA